LGDLASTIVVSAVTNPGVEFTVSLGGDEFVPPLVQAPPIEAAFLLQRHTDGLLETNPSERES
jgi:hypothetical protein